MDLWAKIQDSLQKPTSLSDFSSKMCIYHISYKIYSIIFKYIIEHMNQVGWVYFSLSSGLKFEYRMCNPIKSSEAKFCHPYNSTWLNRTVSSRRYIYIYTIQYASLKSHNNSNKKEENKCTSRDLMLHLTCNV